jgi:uncharacterized ubiquitin-like protein YukD
MIREITKWLSSVTGKELEHVETSTQFLWQTKEGTVIKLEQYLGAGESMQEDFNLYTWLRDNPSKLPVVKILSVEKLKMPEDILFYGGRDFMLIEMEALQKSKELENKQQELMHVAHDFNQFFLDTYDINMNSYSIVSDLMDAIAKSDRELEERIVEFFKVKNKKLLGFVLEVKDILQKIVDAQIYWFDCHEMQFMQDSSGHLKAIDLDNDSSYMRKCLNNE